MIEVCLENNYYYIENGNGNNNNIFKDGLHLQNSGKKILWDSHKEKSSSFYDLKPWRN